jgi:hypothetical protein
MQKVSIDGSPVLEINRAKKLVASLLLQKFVALRYRYKYIV